MNIYFAYVVASEDTGRFLEIGTRKYYKEFGNMWCSCWFTCKSSFSLDCFWLRKHMIAKLMFAFC